MAGPRFENSPRRLFSATRRRSGRRAPHWPSRDSVAAARGSALRLGGPQMPQDRTRRPSLRRKFSAPLLEKEKDRRMRRRTWRRIWKESGEEIWRGEWEVCQAVIVGDIE